MWEEVEALKHETNLRTDTGDVGLAVLDQSTIFLAVAHQFAFDINTPIVNLLQVIDAAQQRGFTRATGTDNHNDLPAFDREINAIQHGEVAEAFDDLLGSNHLPIATICLLLYTHRVFPSIPL